ncbi:MAG: ExbD/TolR family protein [Sandaracinaceae bacterium]
MGALCTLLSLATLLGCGGAQGQTTEPSAIRNPAPVIVAEPLPTTDTLTTDALRLPHARHLSDQLPAAVAVTLTIDHIAIDGHEIGDMPAAGSPLHEVETLSTALSERPPVSGPSRTRVTLRADERVDLQALASVMLTLARGGLYEFEFVAQREGGSLGRMTIAERLPTHPAPPSPTRRLFLGINANRYVIARVPEHGGEPTEVTFRRDDEAEARRQVTEALRAEVRRSPDEHTIILVIAIGTYGDLITMMDLALDEQLYVVSVADAFHL